MSETSLMDNPNLAMVEIAAQGLGELCESLVFVGGCATGLLVTAVRAHDIRATEDVDVVARVATSAPTIRSKLAWRVADSNMMYRPTLRYADGSGLALRSISCRLSPVSSVSIIAGTRSPSKRRNP